VTTQRRLDEQAHAWRGNGTMQEAVDDARRDLRRDLGLFLCGADHDEHEIGPRLAQAFRHDGEIALDEHAVEQARRHAAAVQVRREFRFGGDEDEIVRRIDRTAQQPDERPILRNRGDRDRRLRARDVGRIELRLRQHDVVVGTSLKIIGNEAAKGTLTRYVSLSGKAAPRPRAEAIRELRPVPSVQ